MRVISERQLEQALASLPASEPRVVASGNLAAPRALLDVLERTAERYRLFMLAAQAPLPRREGVIFETPFVGPGMRDAGERLDYLPMRLSLVRGCSRPSASPTSCCCIPRLPVRGRPRSGSR